MNDRLREFLNRITPVRYILVLISLLRSEGAGAAWRAAFRKLHVLRLGFVSPGEQEQLARILAEHSDEQVILFRPLVNWHIPLYQRPQHIALNLARNGFLYFFCTDNCLYDNVQGYEQLADGLYLSNRFDSLLKACQPRIVHLCSSDNQVTWEFVESELESGNMILYEYIDEIHGQVSGFDIPLHTFEKHENILRDERCMVVATADKLFQDVLNYRSKNCALITNGVDYQHFAQAFHCTEIPDEMRKPVQSGRPVIGYFGALASWFDYELVLRVARERPEYEIVLIGWDYDNSMSGYRLSLPNLNIIGPVKYQHLPHYAHWFDVAIIPFQLNEITESTSPIKLFEYMALGKPVVTTALPECRKYRSVLIGEDHGDFMAKLDLALTLREDEAYKTLLTKEALENTWETKASAIARLIRANRV